MRSSRISPLDLSSSYFTLEPKGISTTQSNSWGSLSPGVTSCQGWIIPAVILTDAPPENGEVPSLSPRLNLNFSANFAALLRDLRGQSLYDFRRFQLQTPARKSTVQSRTQYLKNGRLPRPLFHTQFRRSRGNNHLAPPVFRQVRCNSNRSIQPRRGACRCRSRT